MIHNRKVCNQVDMTDNDLLILLGLSIPIEPRKTDRTDAEIMLLRTKAHNRGGTATEIQNNVLALSVQCAICGEYTGHCGSLTGLVHKWGPVSHEFIPIAYI